MLLHENADLWQLFEKIKFFEVKQNDEFLRKSTSMLQIGCHIECVKYI